MTERRAAIEYRTRAEVEEEELQRLFEDAWGKRKVDFRPVLERSFTWVTAHVGDALVGFVNVAWDGGVHFFLLDTTVHPTGDGAGSARSLSATRLTLATGRVSGSTSTSPRS